MSNEVQEVPVVSKNAETETEDLLKCPKCGSLQIHIDKKGFDASDACCGAIICGPLGLLFGQRGANKIQKTCLKCNKSWL